MVERRLGDGAYKLEFLGEFGGLSVSFNVGDLSPYLGAEDMAELRTISFQGGNDVVIHMGYSHFL